MSSKIEEAEIEAGNGIVRVTNGPEKPDRHRAERFSTSPVARQTAKCSRPSPDVGIIGAGDLWVTEFVLSYDRPPSFTVSIMEFLDGEVSRETQSNRGRHARNGSSDCPDAGPP